MADDYDIALALDALRSDANVWDRAADDLAAPRAAIDPLGLGPGDVMSYAAAKGLDKQYNQARALIQDMIDQAGSNFRALSASLRAAADRYAHDEDQHALDIDRAGRG
ncbi:hypothetical protein DL991_42550 [Amycolatopsis sp. WAC 01375]|uniref:hypothetical protein n=1 Tax=Amycolatopsis sp. WAC 01375 TaxID=2203194 RepID=UPI000F7810C2|nr:hypothetical protein [Amycolatopsis sp. WAC 01375]RSM68022.1 hypothetical protein DL991_42550 [Amycolatopsis sp. WAC 01375]